MNLKADFYHDTPPNEVMDAVNTLLAEAGSNCSFEEISEQEGLDDCLVYGLVKAKTKVYELYYLDDNGVFPEPELPLCARKERLEEKFREFLEHCFTNDQLSYELKSKEWKSFFATATFQEILNALESWGQRANDAYEYGGRFSLEIHEREIDEG